MEIMVHRKVVKLFRLLDETSGSERTQVLLAIDEALAFAGLGWADVADDLVAPSLSSREVLKVLDAIERGPKISSRAKSFVSQLREQAQRHKEVEVSPAQFEWFRGLWKQAEPELFNQSEPKAPRRPLAKVDGDTNVIQFPKPEIGR